MLRNARRRRSGAAGSEDSFMARAAVASSRLPRPSRPDPAQVSGAAVVIDGDTLRIGAEAGLACARYEVIGVDWRFYARSAKWA